MTAGELNPFTISHKAMSNSFDITGKWDIAGETVMLEFTAVIKNEVINTKEAVSAHTDKNLGTSLDL